MLVVSVLCLSLIPVTMTGRGGSVVAAFIQLLSLAMICFAVWMLGGVWAVVLVAGIVGVMVGIVVERSARGTA